MTLHIMQGYLMRDPQASQKNNILDEIRSMPEIELAWIAGFFDGEGHTNVRINKLNGRLFKTVHVSVGQQCEEVIKYLKECYGGNIYMYAKERKASLNKDFYQWSIVGTRAVKFLHDIYPYLRVKKEQVDNVIAIKYGDKYDLAAS